jgi:hypothetical protein
MATQNTVEDIDFVKKVMEESRKTLIQDGVDFLRWGILLSFGIFVSYFSDYFHWQKWHMFAFWFAIVIIGWGFTIRSYIKVRKRKSTSFTGKIIWSTWIGCGIALTILGFVGQLGGVLGELTGIHKTIYIVAVTAAIMGIGYYANGILIGSRWYIFFAICWWCGSILLFFYYRIESLLIFGLMMLCFQVIPGYIFVRQRRKDIQEAKE